MPRPLKWPGILGEASAKIGGTKTLSNYLGISYSSLRRWSYDEGRMPKLVRQAVEQYLKECA